MRHSRAAGGRRPSAAALHFFIAFVVVLVFHLAARRLPVLARAPFRSGIAYGIVVYAVMNGAIVPLSAAASGVPSGSVLVNGLLIHMFGVGLPAALSARAGERGPSC